jgi:hypothetical protein
LAQPGHPIELLGEGGNDQPSAAGREVRREDFGVPAAARPDLNHGVVGLDAKEAQRLDRMAIAVARGVRGPAARVRHRLGQLGVVSECGLLAGRRLLRGRSRHGERDQGDCGEGGRKTKGHD